jgi:hypothetical protein
MGEDHDQQTDRAAHHLHEYEFTLPDGSKRYEIIDPACGAPILKQIETFKNMHEAVSVRPAQS